MALEVIHGQNFVYKDLKASHVFVDKNMRVTLIDFGMSEEVSGGQSWHPAGTFHQMSPEMIAIWELALREEKTHDDFNESLGIPGYQFETDLYSLGVLIWEMLQGKPPHGYLQAGTTTEERLAYFEKTREPLPKLPRFPDGTAMKAMMDLAKKLLSTEPFDRIGAD